MKRDPLEIMREILTLLEKQRNEAMSLNAISEKTGIHNVTVRRYVEIIQMVRNEPEIEIIRTGHSIIVRIRKEKRE
ncbi:MAG: HTH domain-containing protein [Candidatus Aenigmarchaeota archaeon]|nr:HTH domain-containing protein [Candidatus Aenigmarchaeota archaeon]